MEHDEVSEFGLGCDDVSRIYEQASEVNLLVARSIVVTLESAFVTISIYFRSSSPKTLLPQKFEL
jgi:hypothetical protein